MALFLLASLAWWGFRQFRLSQQPALLREAVRAFNDGDYRTVHIAIRRALYVDPDDVGANRLMAEFTGAFGLRESVEWRRKVLELEPESILNLAAFVGSLMEHRVFQRARDTMESVESQFESTSGYHALWAALELAEGHLEAARAHFEQASKLDPSDLDHRLNLAVLQLYSSDPLASEEGWYQLSEFEKQPEVRLQALKARLKFAMAARREDEAVTLAMQLGREPRAAFSDRLLAIEALSFAENAQTAVIWQWLEGESQKSARNAYALISTLNASGEPKRAVELAGELAPAMVTKAPLAIAIAQSYLYLQDWEILSAWLQRAQWEGFEYVQLFIEVYFETVTGNTSMTLSTRRKLKNSILSAEKIPGALSNLAEFARLWNWDEGRTKALWALADQTKPNAEPLRLLYAFYKEKKDTRNLYRVMLNALINNANGPIARNNVAALGLLLNRDRARCYRLAEENYQSDPDNLAFASTLAFSLYRQNSFSEGLSLLEKADPAELRNSPSALYYALLLVKNGKKGMAIEVSQELSEEFYLPEEWALLNEVLN